MNTNELIEEKIVVRQDGASTFEVRVGDKVKGGIFGHDLGKYLTDALQETSHATEQRVREEVLEQILKYKYDGWHVIDTDTYAHKFNQHLELIVKDMRLQEPVTKE